MDQRKIVHYGEIYYMDLGQVQLGSRQAGIRPVLVVSSDHRNEYSPVVWVVIITSQIKRLDLKTAETICRGSGTAFYRRQKLSW